MWSGCLNNEELPTDWYKLKEVLVGIFSSLPQGATGEALPSPEENEPHTRQTQQVRKSISS